MAKRLFKILVFTIFANQILYTKALQYLVTSSVGGPMTSSKLLSNILPSIQTISLPSSPNSVPLSSIPSISLGSSSGPLILPSVPLGLSSTSPLSQVIPTSSMTIPGLLPSECTCGNPSSNTPLDQTVLNNLAVALQLLIVSNMLNLPPPESKPAESPPYQEAQPLPVPYVQQPSYDPTLPTVTAIYPSPQNPPCYSQTYEAAPAYPQYASATPLANANFLGSSCVETGSASITSYGVPPPNPRTSLSLMSPYEAIAPNSPYSDPILSSPYGSIITSRSDFQSPYSSVLSSDSVRDYWS